MKKYTNAAPAFSESIQVVETSDPAHADNINAAPIQLLQNTLANRQKINALESCQSRSGINITIPASGWEADTEEVSALCTDIAVDGVTESMTPMLTLLPDSMNMKTVYECGLMSAARTLDGVLRVYAEKAPEAEMHAVLTLIGAGSGISGAEGAFGTATDEEAREALQEIFGREQQ